MACSFHFLCYEYFFNHNCYVLSTQIIPLSTRIEIEFVFHLSVKHILIKKVLLAPLLYPAPSPTENKMYNLNFFLIT